MSCQSRRAAEKGARHHPHRPGGSGPPRPAGTYRQWPGGGKIVTISLPVMACGAWTLKVVSSEAHPVAAAGGKHIRAALAQKVEADAVNGLLVLLLNAAWNRG